MKAILASISMISVVIGYSGSLRIVGSKRLSRVRGVCLLSDGQKGGKTLFPEGDRLKRMRTLGGLAALPEVPRPKDLLEKGIRVAYRVNVRLFFTAISIATDKTR